MQAALLALSIECSTTQLAMTTPDLWSHYGQQRMFAVRISALPLLTDLSSMAEEAAAVMICCMPTTATFFKLAKAPVRSWLSSASGRALRLTGSHRSDIHRSGSRTNLKGSLESGWNAAYSHPQGREHNAIRVDREFDTYSLQQMNQKQTPSNVGV